MIIIFKLTVWGRGIFMETMWNFWSRSLGKHSGNSIYYIISVPLVLKFEGEESWWKLCETFDLAPYGSILVYKPCTRITVHSVPLSVYLLQSNLNNISFIKKKSWNFNGVFYSVCCCFTDQQYTVVKFLFIDKMWIGWRFLRFW